MENRTYEFKSKKKDFSQWYTEIVEASGLIDKRFDTKGAFVWMPYGYKIMMNIKQKWDQLFQNNGIQEMYFPLIVPISYAEKNKSWWQGFKEEGYKVYAGRGGSQLQGIIRPTGEPAMYPMFSLWIRSKNDLPIRIYETVNSYRYESKQTRPLIRDREITVWHEIHTAHETKEEAEKEAELHMKLWDEIWDWMAISPLKVNKPLWEVFPGAVGAVEYYSYIKESGRSLENGSVNNLGQAYAKKFDIKFDENNYPWQICTGNGARLLVGVIAQHGDDKGLVIPPNIASIKALIIPIFKKDNKKEVMKEVDKIRKSLGEIITEVDDRDINPGHKFFDWEIRGIPLRIEIGPKDIEQNQAIIVRRDTLKKETVPLNKIKNKVNETLKTMQEEMLLRAKKDLNEGIIDAKTLNEMKKVVESGKIARVFWSGNEADYDKINAQGEGFEGFGTDLNERKKGKCVVSGKETNKMLYVSRTY